MTEEDKLFSIFSHFDGKAQELIPILQRVQAGFGYLPEGALHDIAKFTRVSESRVFAVATFYSQFRFKPIGKKHIMACRGTACHVRGAPRILDEIRTQLGIKEGETTKDMEYSLETVACIGCCALAPCVTINDDVHGRLNLKKVVKIFSDEAGGEEE